jgi:hypothetical protein
MSEVKVTLLSEVDWCQEHVGVVGSRGSLAWWVESYEPDCHAKCLSLESNLEACSCKCRV